MVRVSWMTAMQYRGNFLVEMVGGGAGAAAMVLPLIFVFDHTTLVAGWSFPEALLVTAFFLFLSGVMGGLVEPNLGAIVEGVRSGQLDYVLLKPVDAQLQCSFRRVSPSRIWDFVAATVVGGWALRSLPAPGLPEVAACAGLAIAGIAAMYSLWVGVVCLSFYFVRVDNLRYLLDAVTDAGRWPISVYGGWIRIVLTTLIPVGLVTSFPAMALIGRLDAAMAIQSVVVAVVGLGLSRVAWLRALRHYASASS